MSAFPKHYYGNKLSATNEHTFITHFFNQKKFYFLQHNALVWLFRISVFTKLYYCLTFMAFYELPSFFKLSKMRGKNCLDGGSKYISRPFPTFYELA